MNYIKETALFNEDDTVNAIIEICPGTNKKDELVPPDFSQVVTIREVLGEYPFYYGSFPQTLADDGDPLDFILFTEKSHKQLDIVKVDIIGAIHTIDCGERDDKILCVESNHKVKKIRKKLKTAFNFLLKYKGRNSGMQIQKALLSRIESNDLLNESNLAYKFKLQRSRDNAKL